LAQILVVGVATLDVVNFVDGYPLEDSEVRAADHEQRRGGNAANTAVVLSQLGHRCTLAATLVKEPDARPIVDDLMRHRVDGSRLVWLRSGKVPTSYITINRRNGSRTIVHYRNLPEYSEEWFAQIPLADYDWVHFEGRNVSALEAMLHRVRDERPGLPISLEIEKVRPGIERLLSLPALVICSRAYAEARGHSEPRPFLRELAQQAPQADLICAWGAAGAAARDAEGNEAGTGAFRPPQVVETLAAGDVFNAALIDARLKGEPLPTAITTAAKLAGRKCGQRGLADLVGVG